MDVSSETSTANAARNMMKHGVRLDAIINNAAILLPEDHRIHSDSEAVLMQTMQTNLHGPARVIRHFLPMMQTHGRIVNLSSEGGSMTDPVGGWSPAYCVSKAALNGLTRQLAHTLAGEKISVNAVCPGWVQTDMGGMHAPRSVMQGAATQVWLVLDANQALTGKFFRDKRPIPW
jgi:NAD(P)-dependent dehydrogenase (short-subunit alcohol dehydrogenase family)